MNADTKVFPGFHLRLSACIGGSHGSDLDEPVKLPKVLIVADLNKPGTREAMASAEAHLRGRARISRRDLFERIEH